MLIEYGGEAPINICYDYREIHWKLRDVGELDCLLEKMSFEPSEYSTKFEELVFQIYSFRNVIIYLFDNNKNFRDAILEDTIKISYMLICLVLGDNINKVSSLVEFIRNGDMESHILDFLLIYNTKRHRYDTIEFLLKYFSDKINDILENHGSAFVPKENISDFLSDERISKENKDEQLTSHTDFTVKEVINYAGLYRIIDKEFLLMYFDKLFDDEKRLNLISYMLDNHSEYLTFEDIKDFIRALPSGYGDMSDISIQIIFLLCNTTIMKQAFR